MPDFEVRDVVKVPFPYTDRPVQQRRPGLVVAAPEAPASPPLLWVLMVASTVNRGRHGDVTVSDLDQAGLPVPTLAFALSGAPRYNPRHASRL